MSSATPAIDPEQTSDEPDLQTTHHHNAPPQVNDLGRSRPRYPMSQAAQMAGVSVSTIKRRRVAGDFPNAVQDDNGTWLIPVEDLLAAGLHLNRPEPPQVTDPGQSQVTQGSDPGLIARVSELERLLAVSEAHRAAAEQLAAERLQRAELAVRALHMLDASRPPTNPPTPAEPPTVATPAAVDDPPRRRGRFARWLTGE